MIGLGQNESLDTLVFSDGKKVTAIVKAHFAFYFAIPKLMAKRHKINQKNNLVGKMEKSILVKNKLKGIKNFSDL